MELKLKNKEKGYDSFEFFGEENNEILCRTNAIANKLTEIDIPIKYKKNLIDAFIRNYFYKIRCCV